MTRANRTNVVFFEAFTASVLLWCGSCADAPSPLDPGATSPDSSAQALDAVVEVDVEQPTVVHVSWNAPAGSSSWVEFGNDGVLDRTTPPTGAADVSTLVVGFKAGHVATLRAVTEVDGARLESELFEIPLAPAPDTLPDFEVTISDAGRSQVSGSYLAISSTDLSVVTRPEDAVVVVGIIDSDGDYVWWHHLPPGRSSPALYPSNDGSTVYWMEHDVAQDDPVGKIVRMSLDGTVVSETVAAGIHHGATELPGGRFAFLGRRFEAADGAEGDWLMSDLISVAPEGDDGSGAAVLFDYLDDWWGGSMDAYWLPPCDDVLPSHMGYTNVCELCHTNSIVYVAAEDALYVFARHLDTLLRIDATTGTLTWQLSGMYSDFTFADGTSVYEGIDQSRLWSWGHFSQVWPGGLVMFDNGWNYAPKVSSVAEYAWDEATGTVEEVWRYTEPNRGYVPALGDVRKLSSGNYLISWQSLGRTTEVSPSGEVVWSMDSGGVDLRRVYVLEDLYDLRKLGVGEVEPFPSVRGGTSQVGLGDG